MNDLLADLDREVPLQGMLGYLNFSEGRPDARFHTQINLAFRFLAEHGSQSPWQTLAEYLRIKLNSLHKESSAFRDINQVEAVLTLALEKFLPAYREHHSDLLGHCPDADLFQPFFLCRVCEAVLAQRGPWDEEDRILGGALRQLNDYVGHRPLATLESRPRGEPFDHERFRPVPLFLKGVGIGVGKYHDLLKQALEILAATDSGLLQDACFDPELLDELALDSRGYDFNHPADKRPNYCFGEWDPHFIDNQGRFRRYVVRQMILDALLLQIETGTGSEDPRPAADRLWEAAAVLAGTILMATGVSGAGPTNHDSSITLTTLVPRIARYRDTFYAQLLKTRAGEHGKRLQVDAKRSKQPFGGIRQRLNQFMAQQRAFQLQQRHLALLFAEIGYPAASRRAVAKIPVVSARLLTEIHLRLTGGQHLLDRGEVPAAAQLLPEIEDLLHRGIACGAMVDPWNVLGFQGQYPRFTALEDSIRDPRIEELIEVVGKLLSLYARVLSEGAATGKLPTAPKVGKDMKSLAEWWDRFATFDVSEVSKVHGGQALESAEHVAQTLGHWRERGEAAADLAFWREHLEGFHSPKAFSLVVEALLRKEDFRAAMALLTTWLGQREQVPLQQDEHSFHTLALRWMLGVCARAKEETGAQAAATVALIAKFFDYLEANAEEYWEAPRLKIITPNNSEPGAVKNDEEEEDLYGAAYEDVTYKDSTDDDVEGEVLDIMPQKDFDLTAEAEPLEKHLRFLSTLARLWNIATRSVIPLSLAANPLTPAIQDTLTGWLNRARQNYQGILALLDTIHGHEIPRASGSYDSLVEFDRRRVMKEQLLGQSLGTCLETTMAIGALQGLLGRTDNPLAEDGETYGWEKHIIRLEQSLWRGETEAVRKELKEFLPKFRQEPLLYTPLGHGGHPRQIMRASLAQIILRALVANLPRLGLLRETFDLLRTAKAMEDTQPLTGPRVTEFDTLFRLACQALVDAVVDAASGQKSEFRGQKSEVRSQRSEVGGQKAEEGKQTGEIPAPDMVRVLETLIEPLMGLWIQHSKGLRVSMIEGIPSPAEWNNLCNFIRRYGGDLFQPRFMAPGNLRGILHQGVSVFLDYLQKNPDPLKPNKLLEELDKQIPLADASRYLHLILQTVIENFAEYQDYKATTTQSDYGENLYQLFEFLRLKASYERNAWQLRPVYQVHEVLVRRHHPLAAAWREQVKEFTRDVGLEHLEELGRLEKTHGMRLATIADRMNEKFIKPLEIDRVCALIEPAMESARGGNEDDTLERELQPLAETPTGVGMEVPYWLNRLEAEIERVRQTRTAVASLAENLYQIPKVFLPWVEVLDQLKDWEKEKKK